MQQRFNFAAKFCGSFHLVAAQPVVLPVSATADAFRLWLTARWAELPDALPAVTAAKLCGSEAKVITKLVRDKRIRGTVVGHVMLCVKSDWIAWLTSPEMIATNKNGVYVGLMREFKRKRRNPTA